MPARNPTAGLPGVDGVLVVTISPDSSSKATTSVKVPPVSMPIRMLRSCRVIRLTAASKPAAISSSRRSEPCGPTSCTPTGSPSLV